MEINIWAGSRESVPKSYWVYLGLLAPPIWHKMQNFSPYIYHRCKGGLTKPVGISNSCLWTFAVLHFLPPKGAIPNAPIWHLQYWNSEKSRAQKWYFICVGIQNSTIKQSTWKAQGKGQILEPMLGILPSPIIGFCSSYGESSPLFENTLVR